jgi:cytochrome c5
LKMKSVLWLAMGVFLAFSSNSQEASKDDIQARIQPLGKVHVSCAKAETAAAGPRSGLQVYAKACVACHSVGVLGAPKLQDAADWAPRMAQGLDVMLGHAIKGYNAMPPKGTCGDCSDDEIKAAIEHMIEGL